MVVEPREPIPVIEQRRLALPQVYQDTVEPTIQLRQKAGTRLFVLVNQIAAVVRVSRCGVRLTSQILELGPVWENLSDKYQTNILRLVPEMQAVGERTSVTYPTYREPKPGVCIGA